MRGTGSEEQSIMSLLNDFCLKVIRLCVSFLNLNKCNAFWWKCFNYNGKILFVKFMWKVLIENLSQSPLRTSLICFFFSKTSGLINKWLNYFFLFCNRCREALGMMSSVQSSTATSNKQLLAGEWSRNLCGPLWKYPSYSLTFPELHRSFIT